MSDILYILKKLTSQELYDLKGIIMNIKYRTQKDIPCNEMYKFFRLESMIR